MFRFLCIVVAAFTAAGPITAASPNIVWIVAEDMSPNLGCYGDVDAITPHLDAFGAQGTRFTRVFTHAPVCAPSRSGLITGMYPTSLGSHHMRSKLVAAPPLFTDELAKAGYAVFWPGKTDFNFDLPKDWTDTRDWTKNLDVLPKNKPFFAYINLSVTHESQVRAKPGQYQKNTTRLTPAQRRDPAKVKLPPYFPDHADVRRDVATYHDNVTAMDALAGDILKMLDERKLRDNTVVFFFGDHGWGLSRGKRWCYDSGTRTPLLVRWPGKLKPGSVRDDLIAFVDFAPTVLRIAGVDIPKRLQGHDFLGGEKREFAFSARDRMDEAEDRIRSVRSEKYRYVKNFQPEVPYAQWINYMDEMPTMKVWRQHAFETKLNDVQKAFFAKTKPAEEFYALDADPHETKNLIASVTLQNEVKRHRATLDQWIEETKDLGAIPEKELIRRGVVKDLLSIEYEARRLLHPKTSPVPD